MQFRPKALFAIGALISLVSADVGATVVAYPKNGQSEKQQTKDKAECSQWATQQTGVDPEQMLKQQQQPQANQPTTGAGRGAAKGAAAGAVGGAIAGNAGTGAAVGAGVGATGGAVRRRKQEKQAQEQQQAGQAQTQQQLTTYDNAKKTCLEGKGYSVG
jgi:hypothetical protein